MQDVELEKFHRIERNNLIHLLKLSVKNLIDYALSLNCGLEEEEAPLYQLFVVLEKILQHGLKEKNSLFSSRSADFFGVIEILKTELDWSEDLIKSVNNMSQLKTVVGRGRAFLRLAMMQKKVHLLLLCLVDNEEKLREHYHTHALLLAEEAHIISGLLVGLNVIDCNLCLKERDLDNLPQVIQLVVYLKEGNYLHSPTPPPSPQLGKLGTKQDYQNILEQKSYIEEINEKLKWGMLPCANC